jgi:hypothetical protein
MAANEAREHVLVVRPVSRDGVGEALLEIPYPGDYAPTLDVTGEPEVLFIGVRPWVFGTHGGGVRPYVLRALLERPRRGDVKAVMPGEPAAPEPDLRGCAITPS